jgi:hypothetical protein
MLRPASLLSAVRTFDAPLWPRESLPSAGACYRALRRLPGRVFHPLEERVFQDAPWPHDNSSREERRCPLRKENWGRFHAAVVALCDQRPQEAAYRRSRCPLQTKTPGGGFDAALVALCDQGPRGPLYRPVPLLFATPERRGACRPLSCPLRPPACRLLTCRSRRRRDRRWRGQERH